LTDLLTAGSTYVTTTTPPRFDNATNLATTEFVRSSGFQFNGTAGGGINSNTTLTLNQLGNWYQVQTASVTATLPPVATAPPGGTYTFMVTAASFTIKGNASENIVLLSGGSSNTYLPAVGETVTLVANPVVSSWYIVQAGFGTNSFASFFGSIGWQKLPGGLVIQWGAASCPVQQTTLVNFPLAFPNNCLQVTGNIGSSIGLTANTVGVGVQANGTKTGFNISVATTTASGAPGVDWIAIGN
jgi:hypothetical protein